MTSSLQHRLKRAMRIGRLSCRDVAAKAGVSFATVSRVARGRSSTWHTRKRLEDWLGASTRISIVKRRRAR